MLELPGGFITKKEGEVFDVDQTISRERHVAARVANGHVSVTLSGPSPKNEEGTPEIADTLVRKLSEAGGKWANLKECHQGHGPDFVVDDPDGVTIDVQVERDYVNRPFWKELDFTRLLSRAFSVTDAADALKEAVEHKTTGKHKGVPHSRCILALDGVSLPLGVFECVIRDYHRRYGQWTSELGFHSVWLVARSAEFTHRLDVLS